MPALLDCTSCTKAAPEKKVIMSRGDFAASLHHHMTQFHRRVVFEHQQAVGERERELQESVEAMRRENRELRSRLRLPEKEEVIGFRSSDKQDSSEGGPSFLGLWPPPASSLSHRRHASPVMAAPLPAHADGLNLPLALRSGLDDQDCALHSFLSDAQSPAKAESPAPLNRIAVTSLATAAEVAAPERCLTIADDYPCGEAQYKMLDAQYKMFELWPAWTEEHKSFADKISDHCKTSSTSAFPRGRTGSQLEAFSSHSPNVGACIISPSAPGFLVWNVLFLIVLTYEVLMFPMWVFDIPKDHVWNTIGLVAVIYWTCDLVLSFFVGYYTRKGEFVMDPLEILRNYAKTWLVTDLLVVSVDWFMLAGMESSLMDAAGFLRMGKALRYLRLLRVLRVLRLRKLTEVIRRFDEFINSQYFSIVQSIALNMAGILMCSHFVGCAWYFIGKQRIDDYSSWVVQYNFEDRDWLYTYLSSLHWSLTQFTPGSMGVQPQNIPERGFAVLILVCGMIIFSSIVSSITAATNNLKDMNARYNKQLWILRRFLREQSISSKLVARVVRYSDNNIRPKQQRIQMQSVELLGMLPQSLYMDVMVEIFDEYLEAHPLFLVLSQKSRSVMQNLCRTALCEIVLEKGEELFSPGKMAHSMYFLTKGQMSYEMPHLKTREVVKPRSDENTDFWFCEMVLWTPWVHQGQMSAHNEHDSELVSLDSFQFQEVLKTYHADVWIVKRYGAEYVRKMNEMAGFFTADTSDDVILSDLVLVQSAMSLLDTLGLQEASPRRSYGDRSSPRTPRSQFNLSNKGASLAV